MFTKLLSENREGYPFYDLEVRQEAEDIIEVKTESGSIGFTFAEIEVLYEYVRMLEMKVKYNLKFGKNQN